VKQFGLGLSNPKVEVNPLAPIRQTRVHLGVTSLLSVPGSPFGLHFTRHGIPFANEVSSYGNVQLAKGPLWNSPIGGNRLINLRTQIFGKVVSIPPIFGLPPISVKVPGIPVGTPIPLLSGLSGPQSVYGVGATPINRATDSLNTALRQARIASYPFKYGSFIDFEGFKSYAPKLRANTKNENDSSRTNELNPRNASGVDDTVGKWAGLKTNLERDLSLKDTAINTRTPGAGKNPVVDISSNSKRKSGYPDASQEAINNYITLAYNKIPKRKNGSVTNDFRAEIAKNGVDSQQANLLGMGNTDPDNYSKNNLQEKYGFGNLGKVGADRTNPNSFGKTKGADIKGSDYNGKTNPLLNSDSEFRGDKINATDIIETAPAGDDPYTKDGPKDLIRFFFEDGVQGNNIMLFRAVLTGLTDSFSPGWDKIDIIGRPDGA
jgi:hypothetical protein